uniref:Capsid protein n=1 Tax=Cressdnaviricota sp. TaxID=2748378 RepID=A0A8E7YWE6_9VIRU|nr:capsid protein [Cressdnaviricota sp.]
MPRIHIEDKHTYFSHNALISGVNTDSAISFTHYNVNRPVIVVAEPTYPATGTDENNRIGRKIRTSSLMTEFYLNLFNSLDNLNTNTIYDYYAYSNSNTLSSLTADVTPRPPAFNTNEMALDVSIRHMIVEFDPEHTKGYTPQEFFEYIWDWFEQLNVLTGNYNMHSNRQQIKRESTSYTGNFNILHDKVIHLSLQKPIYHGNLVIPYVRNLNFDSQGNAPTNKRVYQMFIGPTNVFIDYGSYRLGQFIQNAENVPDGGPNIFVGTLSNTLKLSYTDI